MQCKATLSNVYGHRIVSEFRCRRLDTAKAHVEKLLAEQMPDAGGGKVVLEYTSGRGFMHQYLYAGVWRNGYHHQRAIDRAARHIGSVTC